VQPNQAHGFGQTKDAKDVTDSMKSPSASTSASGASPPEVIVDFSAFSDFDSDDDANDDDETSSLLGLSMPAGKPDESVSSTTDASWMTDRGSSPDSDEDVDTQCLEVSALPDYAFDLSDYSDFTDDEDTSIPTHGSPPVDVAAVSLPPGLSLPFPRQARGSVAAPPGLRPPPPSLPPPPPPAHLLALLAGTVFDAKSLNGGGRSSSTSSDGAASARPHRRRTHRGRRRKAGVPSADCIAASP
jgi:hypothetical protein